MKFEASRGVASARWPEQGLELRFDLMRLDRRTGDVSAELMAIVGNNGSAEVLHRSRLSLLSTRSLGEVARRLEARKPGLNWAGLLEAASWNVVEEQRRGRGAMLLREVEEPPAAGWLIEPLLSALDPTIVYGDGGVAKSYLGLALATSIHSGRGLAGLEVARQLRVAYLDFEWTAWPHLKRLRALCGPGELPDLVYVPCQAEGPLSHQVDRLRRVLSEHSVSYVVIDSVALACDGPPEEAESALGFFQALARLEVGALMLAHVNRQGDQDKPFGSAFWHNNARATWYVKRVQELEGRSLDISLSQKKSNDGPPAAPIGLHFDFATRDGSRIPAEPRTFISRIDLADVPDLADQVPLKDRIARLLAGSEPLKVHEIAEQLDARPDTVDKTLRRYGGRLFAQLVGDAAGTDRVSRWKSIRTGVPDSPGHASDGLPATEADTVGRPPMGGATVRPTEPRPVGEIQTLPGLPDSAAEGA